MPNFMTKSNKLIDLTLNEDGGTNNWNMPMYNNDFNLFKDVDNEITFVVRNTDRKYIDLTGSTLTIYLLDKRTHVAKYQTTLVPIDLVKGKAKMVLEPYIIEDWDLDSYIYNITYTLGNKEFMLFVDANLDSDGFFSIKLGPKVEPRPSYEQYWDTFTPEPIASFPNLYPDTYRMSDFFPGNLQRHNIFGVHTLSVQMKNFTGFYVLQGSLDESSPAENSWFDIKYNDKIEQEFNHFTDTIGYTIEANLNWFRLKVRYLYDNVVPLPDDIGEIEKILFRN